MLSKNKMICAFLTAGLSLCVMGPLTIAADTLDEGQPIQQETQTEIPTSDTGEDSNDEPLKAEFTTGTEPVAETPRTPSGTEGETPVEDPVPEGTPAEDPEPEGNPAEDPEPEGNPAEDPEPEGNPAEDPKPEGNPAEDPEPEETPAEDPEPTDPTPEVPPTETTEPTESITPTPTPEVSEQPTQDENSTDTEEPAQDSSSDDNSSTNTELIGGSNIIVPAFIFTQVEKVYAIVNIDGILNIYEGKGEDNRIIGTLAPGSLCYILADEDQEWIYIESGDVRGFVSARYLLRGDEAIAYVKEKGEDNLALAEVLIPAAENAAYRYTTTTVREVTASNELRSSMVEYAKQFLGNPYVWGGTSLTNGTDCSGFSQGIYAAFGYSIPRVSRDQAQYGTKIPIDQAAPGDLIFYARDGVVYHVVMYIGDGQVIHASSPSVGIVITGINYNNAVWATRVIQDEEVVVQTTTASTTSPTMAASATEGTYLGHFKLTSYCSCVKCCGKWSGGPTASGVYPTEGRTVAMAGVPFGTKLNINGQIFTVEDRGTPYGHVDVYITDHDRACEFGLQYADVYQVN